MCQNGQLTRSISLQSRPRRPEKFAFFEQHVRPNSFDRSACHLCEMLRPGKCDCTRSSCTPRQVQLITEANPGTHG